MYDGEVSTEMLDHPNFGTGWRATRWGTKQLTNLDGVRDFLRAGKVAQDNAERDMNLLAERGPQDLLCEWWGLLSLRLHSGVELRIVMQQDLEALWVTHDAVDRHALW